MFSDLSLLFPKWESSRVWRFLYKIELLMSNINNEFPLGSIITGDFNARCSRWWKNYINNATGQETDSLTSSAGCKQIIDKPTRVLNNSMSCIDLIFCTNQNVISNYGVDVSMFKKCVIIISFMEKLTFVSPSHLYMSVKSRIIIRQMLKILKKQYLILIGTRPWKTFL